jgi:hypothetical protein
VLQGQESNQIKAKPGFPWTLVLRWLLGLYIIASSIFGVVAIVSNWAQLQDMRILDSHFNIYPILIGWVMKLACGILLIFRSRWLLITVPAWIGIFLYDFLTRNALNQLPPDFFLAIVIQGCILSFVLWLHSRGRLK